MEPHTDAGDLAAELRLVVGQLVRRFRADGPLPQPQIAALAWIERQGAKTTSQLANLERVRPQSMAHTLAELASTGLVSRSPDPLDGRQILVDLTPEGRHLMDDYRRRGENWVAEAVIEGFDEQERAELNRGIELLSKLAQTATR